MNIDDPELLRERRLEADTVLRQVMHRKEAAMLAGEVRDQASDVAAVESIVSGPDTGLAASLMRCPLGVDHELDRLRKILLNENLSYRGRSPVRKVDCDARGPAAIQLLTIRYVLLHQRMHRKAFAHAVSGTRGEHGQK